MTRVNYKVDRDYVARQRDWAKDAAISQSKEFNNEVLDILIQSGILVMAIGGPYRINTGNFLGTFKVANPVVELPEEDDEE